MINLEDVIDEIVKDYIARQGISGSSYARSLIIKDLRERGLLPDSLLAELAI